jgi:hypothetical protein
MTAICLPRWTAPAGQLYCALKARYEQELSYDNNPRNWPTQEEVLRRFEAVCLLFGVEMKLEMRMPEELVENEGAYWADETPGAYRHYQAPAYKQDSWSTKGMWVVKNDSTVLCFHVVDYPRGGPSISFTRRDNRWEFGGYGDMPIRGLFDILFCIFEWCKDEKAREVAGTLGGALIDELDGDAVMDQVGIPGLDRYLHQLVFAQSA